MSGELNLLHESNENLLSFGGLGIRVLTGSAVSTEHFAALQALSDATISFTSNLEAGDSSVSSLSIPKGFIIYGNMSSVVVGSGSVVGYIRKY